MKILHIDASARIEGSHSRALSAHFVKALTKGAPGSSVDRIDLALSPPRHFGAWEAAAVATPVADHSPEMRAAIADSDAFTARLLTADALVIGTPIYNFGMPSTLKAFFDHVSRNGLTFVSDETGTRGLLGELRVAVLVAAGGSYGPGEMFDGMDALTPHIRAVLGFMGVTDLAFVTARPMLFAGPDAAEATMARALAEVDALAVRWLP
ncbi:FMN-dependent NADH-azoreductase [Sphingomonas sp. CCH5-D11]|jgi:FMN-dependent NADH-azoreductase|uniref:FMN-dependent NADH-azoreductase n=1 Tax=Sphingomonas sp. CCH5-D11 TaxID=1768786 RepID=UPI0009EBBFEA|nr:NAD(P)H-dependent oxidoreductase [Sphingomonas sp. CCH5-D11]